MKLVTRNDDPPLGDMAVEALFEDIYAQFPDYMTEDDKEKLSVWIADHIGESFVSGYKMGKEALHVGP